MVRDAISQFDDERERAIFREMGESGAEGGEAGDCGAEVFGEVLGGWRRLREGRC